MPFTIGTFLVSSARTAYLILILLSAAAYGLTRESGILAFNWAMGITIVVWLLGHFASLRLPRCGIWAPVLCLLILLYGWAQTGLSLAQEMDDAPEWLQQLGLDYGAYYAELAIPAMIRNTVLLGAFLMAIDMFRSEAWGRALLLTLSATAVGMVAFFLLQKLTGSLFILKAIDNFTPLSFATFRYWGNAASFLNLLWPLLAAIAVHTGSRKARGWSLWMAAAILVFASLYLNVSKAGHILGLVGLPVFLTLSLIVLARSRRRSSRSLPWKPIVVSGIIGIVFGAVLLSAIQWDRWSMLFELSKGNRLVAYSHFLNILPDSAWTGFGPGSFQRAHWFYIKDDPGLAVTPYWVAHQDYLQTLVEWGYLGTALWGLLLLPPAIRLLLRCLRRQSSRTESHGEDHSYAFSLREKALAVVLATPSPFHPLIQAGAFTAVFLTALHATADFPMQILSLQFYFMIWIALGWQNAPWADSKNPSAPDPEDE